MIFCRIDRFVSLLLVASLLLCCVPALAVPAAAADTEMYLYNGAELPVLPGYSASEYPYAFILYSDYYNRYTLYLSSVPFYRRSDGYIICNSSGICSYCISVSPFSSWGSFTSSSLSSGSGWGPSLIWCNFDVLNVDFSGVFGDVFMSASDPVPVSPPPSITSISIVSPETVQAGLYIVASVDVAGTGDFDSSATLTLSGNTSSGTYLEKGDYGNNWTLFCGSDETASTLTLTAASVQDPNVTASTTISVEHAIVDPTDPSDPDDPDDPSDPSDPTTPEETQPGNSGALTDKSDEISDGLGDIHDFEQSQKDVLDNNMDTIMVQVDFVNLIPALAFVGNYINLAWVSMLPVQLIFTVPLFLGLFFFLCSRIPGATRWKPRRPPPDPTKKR